MIELFSANTPNGKKISIMLEEIGYDYKVTKVDLDKGDQFNSDFKKISPFSKIPVILDHENNHNSPLAPCGMCRQAIREQTLIQKSPIKLILTTLHGQTIVISDADDLLPLSFTLKN